MVEFVFVMLIVLGDGTKLDVKYQGSSVEDCQGMAKALAKALQPPPDAKVTILRKCEDKAS